MLRVSVSRGLVLLALLVLPLAGCGGAGQAALTPLDPVTPSASPSPSPTVGLEAPFTNEELVAAARQYWSVLTRAVATSDSALYATVVSRSCGCFPPFAAVLDKRRAAGQRAVAKETLLQVTDPHATGQFRGQVSIVFKEADGAVVDAQGRVVEKSTGTAPRQEVLHFQRTPAGLRVVRIDDFGLVG